MNCKQAELWIQRSLDETLSPTEREALDAHLKDCPTCSAHWREYRQLSRAATQWVQEPVSVSSDFTARLMAKVEERAEASRPSTSSLWLRGVAFASAFLLAMVGLSWALYPHLLGVKAAATGLVEEPQALHLTPATLLDAIRELPSSLVALQGSVPTSAWILPACLIALAANILLIQHARRRTA